MGRGAIAALMMALSIGLVAWLPTQAAPLPQSGRPTVTPSLTPSPTRPWSALPLVVQLLLTPTPTMIPPTATPQLPPPTYNNCQADPNPGAAPNYPIRIVAINKQAETVTLQNVSTSPIDLTNWRMCSITGNQRHPLSGAIAPGQTLPFIKTGGEIWNNTSRDDGALYTPDGRLASYFVDA